jgi:hypothetical protein
VVVEVVDGCVVMDVETLESTQEKKNTISKIT